MNTEIEKEVKEGLEKLGVKGKVTLNQQVYVVDVYVDGEYFGLWDIKKKTFVE